MHGSGILHGFSAYVKMLLMSKLVLCTCNFLRCAGSAMKPCIGIFRASPG